jgi:hypothetical protein
MPKEGVTSVGGGLGRRAGASRAGTDAKAVRPRGWLKFVLLCLSLNMNNSKFLNRSVPNYE